MDIYWHQLIFVCPKCKSDPLIANLSVSSDGVLRVRLGCMKCGLATEWKRPFAEMVADAMQSDVEAFVKEALKAQPLVQTPPLIELPLTEEDKKWERDMHINPEDDDKDR